jgi:hypothetical protein
MSNTVTSHRVKVYCVSQELGNMLAHQVRSDLDPEDGNSIFPRNIGIITLLYTVASRKDRFFINM